MADIFDILRSLGVKEKTSSGPCEFIVACLGNPGRQYERTRHNAGFMFASYMCASLGFDISRARFRSLTGDCEIAGRRIMFVCPQTLMNASGSAVREAAEYYGIVPENIIVVCDDVNFDPGKMRIRRRGTDGGHKGLRDIIYQLSSDEFPRIKIGVGAKPEGYDMADWVLGKLPPDDLEKLAGVFANVSEALSLIVSGKTNEAMNKYN